MVFDVIGGLLADRRQLKQLVLHERIVGLLGKLPIHGCLAPQRVRPVVPAEHSAVALGDVTIHSGLSLERRILEADVCSQSANTTKLNFSSRCRRRAELQTRDCAIFPVSCSLSSACSTGRLSRAVVTIADYLGARPDVHSGLLAEVERHLPSSAFLHRGHCRVRLSRRVTQTPAAAPNSSAYSHSRHRR